MDCSSEQLTMTKGDKQYRLVKLHCAGTNLMGYISRGEDESRTRHNTWNGWECPLLDREQLLDYIKLQNWRLYEEHPLDSSGDEWTFIEEDDEWGYEIFSKDNTERERYMFFEVETTDGKKIEVVDTPCYCYELGWGSQEETYNMEEYNKQFPHGIAN